MISNEIIKLRDIYIKKYKLKSYMRINCGKCIEFADDIYEKLKDVYPTIKISTIDDFKSPYDQGDYEEELFDIDKLLDSGAPVIPFNLSTRQIDGLELGYHHWITIDDLHYDSEAPNGVNSIFELPIYKRILKLLGKYLSEKELLNSGEVVSKDMSIIYDFSRWYEELCDKKYKGIDQLEEFWEEITR